MTKGARNELTAAHFGFLALLGSGSRHELVALPVRSAKPGQQLLARGDRVAGAYLVTNGTLRVYRVTSQGRETTIYRIVPGATCVLAVSAAVAESPYPAWAEAGTRGASFVWVPPRLFQRLLDTESAFREFVLLALSTRVLELMDTVEEVQFSPFERRLVRYLSGQADGQGVVRLTHQAVANELGTAREVVTRVLRDLAAKGVVEISRGQARIVATGSPPDPRSSRG